MNKKLHIVTGASQGLGAALAKKLIEMGDSVATINRSSASFFSPQIQEIHLDLSEPISAKNPFCSIFAEHSLKDYKRVTFTNNAGIVEPISPVEKLTESQIEKNLAINLHAPIVLTSLFLGYLQSFEGESVILNVSSGVARRPKASWSVYSAAKAGLEAFTSSLNKELVNKPNFRAFTFDPGIMDTNMQAKIRATSQANFPELSRFIGFKENGDLQPAEKVAVALATLLCAVFPAIEKQHFTVNELFD